MEAIVVLGRDCRVAYYNTEYGRFHRWTVGESIVSCNLVIPLEEIRDAAFAGKSISFVDRPVSPQWDRQNLLVTRMYQPIWNPEGTPIGIVGLGFTRTRPDADALEDLRAIIGALRYREPQSSICAESPDLASSRVELSGSQRAALRLQRFLLPLTG
jgi:hypothetical protein